MLDKKILTIIPAIGWYAKIEDEQHAPLVCWALTKNADGEVGLSGLYVIGTEIFPADEDDAFLGYAHESELED